MLDMSRYLKRQGVAAEVVMGSIHWTGSQIEAYIDLPCNTILHICVDRLLLLFKKVVEKFKQIIDRLLFDLMMKHNPWTI